MIDTNHAVNVLWELQHGKMNTNTVLFTESQLSWVKVQELIRKQLIDHLKHYNINCSFDVIKLQCYKDGFISTFLG